MKGQIITMEGVNLPQSFVYIPVSRLIIWGIEDGAPCARFLRQGEKFRIDGETDVAQEVVIAASLRMHKNKREFLLAKKQANA
ncbi:MAG: hypothetical protein ABIS26_01445 [Candidatus Paceibacterota bacterium]